MLRFHSFYPWHRHGAYDHLANDQDRAMMEWVLKFNQYDLYSKGHTKPNVRELKPYYDELFAEFLPEKIASVRKAEKKTNAAGQEPGGH